MGGNTFFNKVLYFLGIEDEQDENFDSMDNIESSPFPVVREQKSKGRVINIHQTSKNKVIIFKPSSFEETVKICDEVKNRKAAIVNMEQLDKESAKRILDFLSGSIYALNGTVKKIGAGIFIFAPDNVDISDISAEEEYMERSALLSKYKG